MSDPFYKFLTDKETECDAFIDVREIDGPWKVHIKSDGCIDLNDENSYIHICDLNRHIEKCQEIKRIAEEKFGKDWN